MQIMKRILVVDDEQDLTALLKKFLQRSGGGRGAGGKNELAVNAGAQVEGAV